MRKLLLFLLLSAAVPSAAQPKAPEAFPYPVKTDRLPNGLTVVRVPFHSPGLVAYYTVVRVGSRNEVEPGKTGFAHFFEHMMFKGTKKHPEGERERLLATYGFNDNAFTTDDFTVYHSYGPTAGLDALIELEADRFRNLEYAEPSFRTEALAVLGEYHKNEANPWLRMEERLLGTAFQQHTYRHTTLGFYEDIKAMPEAYAYSRSFFERWYTPDNTLLFIVGDFQDGEVLAGIREHYGPWNRKVAQVPIPAEPPQKEKRTVSVEWPSSTLPRQVLAWHTPAASLTTPSAAIQSVLSDYLVGATSPVYKELVLDKQLVESIGSGFSPHRDPSLFSLHATLKAEEGRPAAEAVLTRAIQELASGKVDTARVQAIQSNIRYSLLMNLEAPDEVAGQLAWYAGIFGSPDALSRHLQNVARVQPEQLVSFAKRYLVETNLTVLTLTPATGGKP
ncbi:pitrilysin family protein [Stigmatella sp. ncwal1]|uniref:Pitrilysin family protein n=1 Tax=Stigmatella ashevillensis TaxID=2995309 RepID=A0ABT5D8X1_9BACT|nr:pitrilysin family protein [Stigmatella ashevillena]MDC0709494.1 pitrilysin family protein [Stigmatella ashevillena]